MTLHLRLAAWIFLVFGSTLAAQTDAEPQWHLPDVLGSAPALFVAEAPEGFLGHQKTKTNQKTPTVGLEPTTTRLRALRSAD